MRRVATTVRTRWAAVPRWAQAVLAIYLVGFAQAAGQHVNSMAQGGIHAYAGYHYVPVQAFLVALVILDPLVVVLVGYVRREGIYLAVVVMVCDIAANWTATWPGPLPWAFYVDGVFVCSTAIPLLRVMPRAARGPLASRAAATSDIDDVVS
jgi:hypothetical protein